MCMRLKKTSAYFDSNTDIVNAFNKYFASIFTKDEDSSVEERDLSQDVVCIIDNVTLLEEEIVAVIYNLDSNKSRGPDGIPVRLLKETAMQIAPSLRVLFNKFSNIGVLPDEWKLANVVPVHKHGEKSNVEHYRPSPCSQSFLKFSSAVFLTTSNITFMNK